MNNSWRRDPSSHTAPPPPPPRMGGYGDRRDRGKSRSPRGHDGGSYGRDFGSGNRGSYRGRGRPRRDMPRDGESNSGYGRSNGMSGNGGIGSRGGGYGDRDRDSDRYRPPQPVDTTKFNASQALRLFAERWQRVSNDLHNDDLPSSEKPQVYKAEAGKSVWGQSKLPLQASVSDFLGELQKALARSKEDVTPRSPSD